MKLKYYMRGLGIGIVLTTLILSIGNTNEKLTDEEIMKRASKLGMITKEESNQNLDDVLNEIMPTQAISLTPAVTPATEPTLAPTPAPTLTPTPEPTPEPTVTPMPIPTKALTENAGDKEGNTASDVSFTIKSGMSSGQVALLLRQEGIIDSAEDFNQYIMNEGKASVIRVGTYTVPSDASYSDIVTKITSK